MKSFRQFYLREMHQTIEPVDLDFCYDFGGGSNGPATNDWLFKQLSNNFIGKLIPQKKWIIVDKMDKKQFMGHIPQKYSTTQMANGAPPSSGISSSTGAPAAS